jgi:hypothetical protein
VAIELYDHKRGFEETINVADLPENEDIVWELEKKLKEVRIMARGH